MTPRRRNTVPEDEGTGPFRLLFCPGSLVEATRPSVMAPTPKYYPNYYSVLYKYNVMIKNGKNKVKHDLRSSNTQNFAITDHVLLLFNEHDSRIALNWGSESPQPDSERPASRPDSSASRS